MPDPDVSVAAAPPQVSRKCAACEEEELLQTKRTGAPDAVASDASGIVQEVLRSPGRPLDAPTRAFMEPRFAQDFSTTRIHHGSAADAAARSVNALAFTVGRNIVFRSSAYAPSSLEGRRLLAHEFAHTLQQGVGSPILLRRAIAEDYDKLRDWLTRGLFDWAITDEEAHKSLVLLKGLNAADLRDTVAAMEKDGLVDNLFSNVSDDDLKKETDLLERINDVRVHKGGSGKPDLVGPCDQNQRKHIDDRVGATKDWAREAKNRANDFAADPAKHADTGKLLDTHFFHEKNNGPLPVASQVSDARQIADNFRKTEVQQNPLPNLCASPFDPLCAALALAYVDRTKGRVVFCSPYFESKAQRQVYHLLHEFMHEFAGVKDRGYGDERVFAYLAATDAMNNADSYALFAVDVNDKEEKSTDIRPAPRDSVSDCGNNEPEVRRRFAFAARMITNALNIIGDPQIGGAEAQTHFKTQDRTKLQKVFDRFKKINEQFAGGINFECESKCDAATGYWRKLDWTVHLCPAWFALSSPDARTEEILSIAIAEELGMDYGPGIGTPAYAKLSEKQAYDSASAYVGYARDVTKKFFT